MGSQVLGTGSNNISGLHGDNSAVGVGNQTGVGQTGIGQTSVDTSGQTVGGEVVSLGGENSGLISRDNSTVGVGNQGLGVSKAVGIGVSSIMGVGESSAVGIGVSTAKGIGVSTGNGIRIGTAIEESLGAQMSSTGKSNCRLVSGDDGTVGVGHQVAGGGDCDAGGENEELHVECLC